MARSAWQLQQGPRADNTLAQVLPWNLWGHQQAIVDYSRGCSRGWRSCKRCEVRTPLVHRHAPAADGRNLEVSPDNRQHLSYALSVLVYRWAKRDCRACSCTSVRAEQ